MILRTAPPAGALIRSAVFAVEPDLVKRAAADGMARFVASTDSPARSDGSIIDQASWKLDGYARNPVVIMDHDYCIDAIVGRGMAAVEQGTLYLDVRWSAQSAGQLCRALYEEGSLNAVSVGFIPGRATSRSALPKEHPYYQEGGWGCVYYDCELLEVSMVVIGDDAEALAERSETGAEVRARTPIDVAGMAAALSADPVFMRALAAQLTLSGAAPAPGSDLGGPQDNAPIGGISFFRNSRQGN